VQKLTLYDFTMYQALEFDLLYQHSKLEEIAPFFPHLHTCVLFDGLKWQYEPGGSQWKPQMTDRTGVEKRLNRGGLVRDWNGYLAKSNVLTAQRGNALRPGNPYRLLFFR
jgi:hypothetical protein